MQFVISTRDEGDGLIEWVMLPVQKSSHFLAFSHWQYLVLLESLTDSCVLKLEGTFVCSCEPTWHRSLFVMFLGLHVHSAQPSISGSKGPHHVYAEGWFIATDHHSGDSTARVFPNSSSSLYCNPSKRICSTSKAGIHTLLIPLRNCLTFEM